MHASSLLSGLGRIITVTGHMAPFLLPLIAAARTQRLSIWLGNDARGIQVVHGVDVMTGKGWLPVCRQAHAPKLQLPVFGTLFVSLVTRHILKFEWH